MVILRIKSHVLHPNLQFWLTFHFHVRCANTDLNRCTVGLKDARQAVKRRVQEILLENEYLAGILQKQFGLVGRGTKSTTSMFKFAVAMGGAVLDMSKHGKPDHVVFVARKPGLITPI
jgi:hypothetical protein